MNARAVWFCGPPDVEVREEEVRGLAEGELLVRTRYSGICGAGHTVGVLGLSPLGILVGALLLRSGVEVLASDPVPWRRAAAACFDLRVMAPDELETALSRADEGGRRTLLLAPAGGAPGVRPVPDGALPTDPMLAAEGGERSRSSSERSHDGPDGPLHSGGAAHLRAGHPRVPIRACL